MYNRVELLSGLQSRQGDGGIGKMNKEEMDREEYSKNIRVSL